MAPWLRRIRQRRRAAAACCVRWPSCRSGLIAILIGVALIAAPAVINALGATFGVDGGSHTVLKPRL